MISCVLIFINFFIHLKRYTTTTIHFLKIIKLHYCEENYSKIT